MQEDLLDALEGAGGDDLVDDALGCLHVEFELFGQDELDLFDAGFVELFLDEFAGCGEDLPACRQMRVMVFEFVYHQPCFRLLKDHLGLTQPTPVIHRQLFIRIDLIQPPAILNLLLLLEPCGELLDRFPDHQGELLVGEVEAVGGGDCGQRLLLRDCDVEVLLFYVLGAGEEELVLVVAVEHDVVHWEIIIRGGG